MKSTFNCSDLHTIFDILISVLQLSLHLKLSTDQFRFAAIVTVLPQLFNMSAHLIRQFIASSICIYVVVQYLTTQRIKVFLL